MIQERELLELITQAKQESKDADYLKAFETLLQACHSITKPVEQERQEKSAAARTEELDAAQPQKSAQVVSQTEASKASAQGAEKTEQLPETVDPPVPVPIELNAAPSGPEQAFRAFLEANLFGQPKAIDAGVDAYLKSISLVKQLNRPCFTIMSLGQSRTGKSELPRLFAQHIHGSKNNLLRVNLAQYQHSAQITTLIGGSPIWVGYEQPPAFGEKKLNASRGESQNKQVILVLEEIEKAHPAVADVLLGILDNGEAELQNGEKSDFSNVIIFMTSNLGTAELANIGKCWLGFGTGPQSASDQQIKNTIQKELSKHYRPEFINRIDKIVVYNDLTP